MMTDEERRLIREAVDRGAVTKIPSNTTTLPPKKKDDRPARIHPQLCDRGGRLWPAAFLDEEDEE